MGRGRCWPLTRAATKGGGSPNTEMFPARPRNPREGRRERGILWVPEELGMRGLLSSGAPQARLRSSPALSARGMSSRALFLSWGMPDTGQRLTPPKTDPTKTDPKKVTL